MGSWSVPRRRSKREVKIRERRPNLARSTPWGRDQPHGWIIAPPHETRASYFSVTSTDTLAPLVMVLKTGENDARCLIRETSSGLALTRNLARMLVYPFGTSIARPRKPRRSRSPSNHDGQCDRPSVIGTTSWHDLALHLIARHVGPSEALRIAKVYLLKWHDEGELPCTALVRPLPHRDGMVRKIEVFLKKHFPDQDAIGKAVGAAGMPERTLKRRFKAATGLLRLSGGTADASPQRAGWAAGLAMAAGLAPPAGLPVESAAPPVAAAALAASAS